MGYEKQLGAGPEHRTLTWRPEGIVQTKRAPMVDDDKLESDQAGYPAEKARQGEIILRTRLRRIIFISGLVGCVLLVLILRIWRTFLAGISTGPHTRKESTRGPWNRPLAASFLPQ